MGCFAALLALISPRLAIIFVWLFSDLLGRAFADSDSFWVPFIGFLLLPWTTLAFALMWGAGGNDVAGFEWFIVILAFFVDLGAWVSGGKART